MSRTPMQGAEFWCTILDKPDLARPFHPSPPSASGDSIDRCISGNLDLPQGIFGSVQVYISSMSVYSSK